MNEAELRARMREMLDSGQMPRELPTAVWLEGREQVSEARIQIRVQPAEHCVLCGEAGPEVS